MCDSEWDLRSRRIDHPSDAIASNKVNFLAPYWQRYYHVLLSLLLYGLSVWSIVMSYRIGLIRSDQGLINGINKIRSNFTLRFTPQKLIEIKEING